MIATVYKDRCRWTAIEGMLSKMILDSQNNDSFGLSQNSAQVHN